MSIERIKFRAQNPITKKWETVESFAEYWPDRPRETHAERLALFFDSCNGVNLDPTTVGQFTGLKDDDGNDIWENDTVDIDGYGWKSPRRGSVAFTDGAFRVHTDGDNITYRLDDCCDEITIRVIGNVHEVTK